MPRPIRRRSVRSGWLLLSSGALLCACGYDRADRFVGKEAAPLCAVGARRCSARGIEACAAGPGGPQWQVTDACADRGLVCVPELTECRTCIPNQRRCDGQTVLSCDSAGNSETAVEECDPSSERVCREGMCVNLCALAAERRSNVGCEYWAVDLDNAMVDASRNAAAQQYAVVISNPQPDLPARVTVEQDDSRPGEPNAPVVIQQLTLGPLNLERFLLGPREVDGSPPGEYDTGTHTALTRHAYRIRSSVPVVAYQFNPLSNVEVFSNDASLLKPVEALSQGAGTFTAAYVAVGWPQTIAATSDPDTNFDPNEPTNLRAFLTIVGVEPNTTVRVESRAPIVAGGPVAATPAGGSVEIQLDPFDVLNLESNTFNADFTGSLISADQRVVVFSGSEASDAPIFQSLAERRCCADHLEEQLDPIRTAGRRFVASVSPNRSDALVAAGSTLGRSEQPEYFRVIAVTGRGARIRTTLPGADREIVLGARGEYADLTSTRDFMIESDEPITLASVSPSQEAAGIPRGLPGGDPSFLIVPPIEQFRSDYVFLTPDKYAFDFIRVIAPPDATVLFNGAPLTSLAGCATFPADGLTPRERGQADPPLVVTRCQLSFPRIDPRASEADEMLAPGVQNDGVHRLQADRNVGLLVDGFDAFVSYAYAGGTRLEQIVPE